MKYVVFASGNCYARGGWGDLHSTSDTHEDALTAAGKWLSDVRNYAGCGGGWVHIVDLESGEVIYSDRSE